MPLPNPNRVKILGRIPFFSKLSYESLEILAAVLGEEHHSAGQIVVKEGGLATRLYIIVSGCAEVSSTTPLSSVLLATLGPEELFGEIALLQENAVRTATVTAVAPLFTLNLDRSAFEKLLQKFPELRQKIATNAELITTANFLKKASPFTALDMKRLKELAKRLVLRSVSVHQEIVRQGEKGDQCYLLQKGLVEVATQSAEGRKKQLALLEAGAIFGESALLTGAPRNATVRALEPCDLLVLRKKDLLQVLGAHRQLASNMVALLRLRDRPRQVKGILVQKQLAEDGTPLIILKNPQRHTYYRLTEEGLFLWERLDGEKNLRDLVLDYFETFKAFIPHVIAEVVAGLGAAGFIESRALHSPVKELSPSLLWWQKPLFFLRGLLEWRAVISGVDPFFQSVYRYGFRILYNKVIQMFLLFVAAGGFILFFLTTPPLVLWEVGIGNLVLAFLASLVLHEAGHAFTVKHFKREVLGVGIGWYWFAPIAFVDTSDMWLSKRGPRVFVTLAGPYTNLVLAGFAGWLGPVASNPMTAAFCWWFACGSYLLVLFSLNPLLEHDGYYALMDGLDRPNLQRDFFRWIKLKCPLGPPYRPELLYGISCVVYVALFSSAAWGVFGGIF